MDPWASKRYCSWKKRIITWRRSEKTWRAQDRSENRWTCCCCCCFVEDPLRGPWQQAWNPSSSGTPTRIRLTARPPFSLPSQTLSTLPLLPICFTLLHLPANRLALALSPACYRRRRLGILYSKLTSPEKGKTLWGCELVMDWGPWTDLETLGEQYIKE